MLDISLDYWISRRCLWIYHHFAYKSRLFKACFSWTIGPAGTCSASLLFAFLLFFLSLLLCFFAFLLLRCSASLLFAFLLFFLSLLLCFSASLLFCFSAVLLLCFSAFLLFFLSLLLCFSASLLLCFSTVLRLRCFVLFCFSSLNKAQDAQYKYTLNKPHTNRQKN